MKVKLAKDWHVRAKNNSPIVVPEGTEVDMLEVPHGTDNEDHPFEVAVGAGMQIAGEATPPAKPEKPEIKPPEKPDLKPPGIVDKPKPPVIEKPKPEPVKAKGK